MNKIAMYLGIFVLLFLISLAVWLQSPSVAVSPMSTTSVDPELQTASNKEAKKSDDITINKAEPVKPVVSQHPLPLAKGDLITSWNFKGAYADNPDLVAKTEDEIKRFSDMLTTATSSAMILAVSIANDYGLLGMGKLQYEYLERAILADNGTTGLPWHNLGVLMERLGAYETARTAFKKAVEVQQIQEYVNSLEDFNTAHSYP